MLSVDAHNVRPSKILQSLTNHSLATDLCYSGGRHGLEAISHVGAFWVIVGNALNVPTVPEVVPSTFVTGNAFMVDPLDEKITNLDNPQFTPQEDAAIRTPFQVSK
ncbi:hypothetical protein M231_07096 [Tremella mesenterica]|uniref:Uncharacterized protein n=1 Tax=Tremella mesenterica TaxID=5217 RepID=A0A4Q1BCY2_TREME|nr:hypothetical protein M231_07096 [Tremella mesenterica]